MSNYCEDYPCCGHTRLDPCPNEDGSPAPVAMTAEEAAEHYYCDICGYSHTGSCEDEDPDLCNGCGELEDECVCEDAIDLRYPSTEDDEED